jgi:hypothetical protein
MMRKKIILPMTIILTILLSAMTVVVFAVDNNHENTPIYENQVDVTGDGAADLMTISGKPYKNEQGYLKGLTLRVKTSEGKSFKIKLKDGYKPIVKVNDLNHDGVNELFVSVPTGANDGLTNYFLYSFNDAKKSKLDVPETLVITSQYEDGYRASIKMDETSESVTFDLNDRQSTYDNLGLYNDGKLNEPMELLVSPFIKLEPAKLDDKKIGLKGIQTISGVTDEDTIGLVKTSWVYDDGSWVLVESSVQKAVKTKEKNKKK